MKTIKLLNLQEGECTCNIKDKHIRITGNYAFVMSLGKLVESGDYSVTANMSDFLIKFLKEFKLGDFLIPRSVRFQ